MTSPSIGTPARRKFGRARLALIGLGVLSAVLFIGGFSYIKYYGVTRVEARLRETDRLRQLGLPSDPQSLGRYYHIDANFDAVGEELLHVMSSYNAAYHVYDGLEYFNRRAWIGSKPTPENIEIMGKHLHSNSRYLQGVRDVLTKTESVRYPIEFSKGLEAESQIPASVKNAVQMFMVEAHVAAENDAQVAASSIRDAVRMAETLSDVPMVISQLARVSSLVIALDELEYVINASVLPEDVIRDLRNVIETLELNGMMAYGIIGERCYSDLHQLASSEREESIADRARQILAGRSLAGDVWSANLFLAFSRVAAITDLAPWERRAASQRLEAELKNQWFIAHAFEQIVLPDFTRMYEAENRALSVVETTKVGLTVLEYAGATGELPETLAALVPQYIQSIPLDPFDGEPLRYQMTNGGFVVYSVAFDRMDNAGMPLPNDRPVDQAEGDVVFRVLDASPYLREDAA